MLVPSIFANSVFDDFFDFPYVDDKKAERKLYGHNAANLMKTDIQEYDDGYQLEIDLPGFKKDEVRAELKDGYLVVSAEKGLDEDEQELTLSVMADFLILMIRSVLLTFVPSLQTPNFTLFRRSFPELILLRRLSQRLSKHVRTTRAPVNPHSLLLKTCLLTCCSFPILAALLFISVTYCMYDLIEPTMRFNDLAFRNLPTIYHF